MKLFKEYLEDYQKAVRAASEDDKEVLKLHNYVVKEFLADLGLDSVSMGKLTDQTKIVKDAFTQMPREEAAVFYQMFHFAYRDKERILSARADDYFCPIRP